MMTAPSFARDPSTGFDYRVVQCDGKRILRLDYSGLTPEGVIQALEQAKPVIASEPPRSIRLLSIWKARQTRETAAAIKRFAAHNGPFIRASAVVGATPLQSTVLVLAVKSQGRENLEVFDDEEQAMQWLAAIP
jgi:hypothetical protein